MVIRGLLKAAGVLGLGLSIGCVGDIGGGDDEDGAGGPGNGPQCTADGPIAPQRALRRLDPIQYSNTMRDLFGDPGAIGDLGEGGEIITDAEVRKLRDNAELAAASQGSWTREVFPCDVDGEPSDACLADFFEGFARRAFRHPLSATEIDELTAVYQGALDQGFTFREAMEMTLEAVLQSPAFLYLFEAGSPDETGSVRTLSDHEVAARLSYFLWNTTPDDDLSSAADRGDLADPDLLAEQADRLLADPRAEATVQSFVSSWLQLDGGVLHQPLEETEKDATLYPEFDDALVDAMRVETEALVRRVFFEKDGTLADLLESREAYVNGPLAELYGVAGPSDASTWQWVELDKKQRAGLLTRSAFLTVLSTKTATAPIRRGVWVVKQMLCTELGTPPPNANNVPVSGGVVDGELLSVRDEVTLRTKDGVCAGCHGVINPIGFTFEHYDAIGRFQTQEVTSGLTIDSSGAIGAGSDVDGPAADAIALSAALGSSETVEGCFVERWYKQAVGEDLNDADACAISDLKAEVSQGASMHDLVRAIVTSDAFRHIEVKP